METKYQQPALRGNILSKLKISSRSKKKGLNKKSMFLTGSFHSFFLSFFLFGHHILFCSRLARYTNHSVHRSNLFCHCLLFLYFQNFNSSIENSLNTEIQTNKQILKFLRIFVIRWKLSTILISRSPTNRILVTSFRAVRRPIQWRKNDIKK